MKRPWVNSRDEQPRRRKLSQDQIDERKKASSIGASLFRRNRTLVGSLSPQVGSASELQGDLRSPRAQVHHLTAHRRRLTAILTAIVASSCLLIWLLYEFTAGISVVPTTSSIIIQQERYQKAINDYMAAHPVERLRFLLNTESLGRYLVQAVPEVESVQAVSSAGFADTRFELLFRKPLAGWLIGSDQYYVDQNGVSFKQNYYGQPTVRVVDNSGVPQTTGTAIASSRFLRFVGRAVALAQTSGLTIEQAIIPSGTTRQVEIKVAERSYQIKFSLDRSVGEQVEDMQRAIVYFDSKQVTPEYIDVRVSGKAYYQ